MSLKDRSIAFIGGGHITEIIVSNLIRTDTVVSRRLIVSDPVEKKLENLQNKYNISIAKANVEAVHAATKKADNFP